MTAAFLALLPVFLVILAGLGLKHIKLVSEAQWLAVDQVCYVVLFPAIIFKEIAGADFTGVPVGSMAAAMMLALCTMFALLLATRRQLCSGLGMNGPQYTSLFQGTTRWHTFVGLAIIPIYFGESAMSLGAVAAAAMIPLLNVVNVAVLSVYASGAKPDARRIALSLLRNPFVISSVGGVLVKLLGIEVPPMILQMLDMIGRGALGLALLTVGAGLRLGEAVQSWGALIAGCVLKLIVLPLMMFAWLKLFGIAGTPAGVAILCSSVPTGAGAYVLARQMGGDAPLVANIMTFQVICAVITIPLVIGLLT